jgi:asparagine synthase (glutamine-hydrolysing)
MCGIAAVFKANDVRCSVAAVNRMRDEVSYRGPDGFGSEFFAVDQITPVQFGPLETAWNAALAHRRLSIIDLSKAGLQPMQYRGRYWITYNGEVYNYIELRRELEKAGHRFRSATDTEVLLAAYAHWGSACFQRFRGMWGLVIYDSERREAVVCRDRLGIKPVYIWRGRGIIAVASEIKQFRHLPGLKFGFDSTAATEYLRTGYEDPARTLFRDIAPLPGGHWVRIDAHQRTMSASEAYWFPEQIQAAGASLGEASAGFAKKFQECVALHLRSDVPVGCALSGGLDSSSIAVTVNHLSGAVNTPLHTFTSTFPGDGLDEKEYANAVLARIRHEAHFDTPGPEMFLADLDRLIWVHDEPVSSTSIYASYCIARLARLAQVPVLLNGQGGDELFGAYWPSYFVYLRELLRKRKAGAVLGQFVGALWPGGNSEMVRQLPIIWRRYRARSKPHVSIRLNGNGPKSASRPELVGTILSLEERARRVYEIRTMFLPRLLKWDDRNSMAFSIEGRYPFLDHELIELVLSFRGDLLYRNGWTKLPLRQGLRNLLPPKVFFRRTKFGFETPQSKWMKGYMRPALQLWLRSDRPLWRLLEREPVRRLAATLWDMRDRSDEAGQQLFRLFVFDRWLDIFNISPDQ